MLTKVSITNFKLFDHVEFELGDRVVLIGPNNAGKTSALQALALWDLGLKRWLEKRGAGDVPTQRSGVTINRRDLVAVPVPAANLLWYDLHVRSRRDKTTKNMLVEIVVEGPDWRCGLEFDYANEEFFYCRPLRQPDGHRMTVPGSAGSVRMAYLPPMSGLAVNEIRLDPGAINVRLGEGRTAEVLRNVCYSILESEGGPTKWKKVVDHIASLFDSELESPRYIAERGEITMAYRTRDGVRLDLSASGRGQQQTLLLLAHMAANPGSVLLLDGTGCAP